MIYTELNMVRKSWLGTRRRQLSLLLPQSWEEVPKSLRIPLLKLLLNHETNTARLKAFALLAGIKYKDLNHCTFDTLLAIDKVMEWLKVQPVTFPLVRSFRHKGKRYYLPAEDFENGQAIEYPIADDYFTKYLNTEKEIYLDKLIATICRPAKYRFGILDKAHFNKNGDPRIPLLSRDQAEAAAPIFEKLPQEVKFSILMYFNGIKELVFDSYGEFLFEGVNDDHSENNGVSFGWWGVYMDIAKEGAFGPLHQVYQSNFHSICMYLVQQKDRYDQREQQRQFSLAKSENDA